jgi:hypothetical protein
MNRYRVKLDHIEWDDGKGEYDTSTLPTKLVLSVLADSAAAAQEHAMSEADEMYGCLIVGCQASADKEE